MTSGSYRKRTNCCRESSIYCYPHMNWRKSKISYSKFRRRSRSTSKKTANRKNLKITNKLCTISKDCKISPMFRIVMPRSPKPQLYMGTTRINKNMWSLPFGWKPRISFCLRYCPVQMTMKMVSNWSKTALEKTMPAILPV